jgi:hypothetical protein
MTGQENITLNLTIDQVNGILQILGEAPFVKANQPISWIISQANPQVAALEKTDETTEQPA